MPFDPSKIRARLASDKKWYKITNLAGGEADVMLYGEIGWLGTTAEDFVSDIKQLQASQINLHLSSPGGQVFDGIAIMNALKAHPANVTVYVDALAASIASVIAMAGDRIVARQAAEFMIHEAAGLAVGGAAEMRDMAELLDRQSDKIAGIYAARAGGAVEDWRAVMAKETWYSAQEAVDAGLADEVDGPSRKGGDGPGEHDMPMAAKWDLSVFRYAGREQAPAPQPVAARAAKPAPPPQPPAPAGGPTAHDAALCTSIGAAIGTEVAAAIRNAVTTPVPEASQPTITAPAVPEVADTACPVHHTDTADGTWDGGANEKRLPSPMPVATAKKVYAWYDNAQVEDGKLPKSAAKLPHHDVSEDGTPGAANLAGVRNALARLPQSDIPESERDAVERHLRAHLADGGGGGDAEDRAGAGPAASGPVYVHVALDDLTAALTAALHARDEPASSVPEPAASTSPEAPAAAAQPAPEAEPGGQRPEADPWTAAVAHLTQSPGADDWAAFTGHLTTDQPSSAATTA